ncbi:MAG: hypothetical protein V3V64_05195 [Acidiferrobacterales bacterium]
MQAKNVGARVVAGNIEVKLAARNVAHIEFGAEYALTLHSSGRREFRRVGHY